MKRADSRQSTMMMHPVAKQITNDVRMEAAVRPLSLAPRCCATRTFTALPIPIRKPVNSDTRMVVDPTAPNASALENLPTTATSAILNKTCKSCDSMSGMLKRSIFFHSEPFVIWISPCPLPLREARFAIWIPSENEYCASKIPPIMSVRSRLYHSTARFAIGEDTNSRWAAIPINR